MDVQTILLSIIIILITIAIVLVIRAFQKSAHYKKTLDSLLDNNAVLAEEQKQHQLILTEYDKLKNHVESTILIDPVTNLPTKHVFEDRLNQTFNQSKRYDLMFAVLELDIDEFRMIDNVLGHDIGDILIKEVVARLQLCLRKPDTLCNISNERFVLLLPQVAKAEAVAYVAQRLLDSITQPFVIGEHELYITACIGISIYPSDGDDVKLLLKNADTALYQAKARGHCVYQFYRQDMHATSKRQLLLNSRLRSAGLYQELTLYYQPQVNLEMKKIIGMEAFLRWNHPDFGLISPVEFLSLAENNGTIIPIGDWVLQNACEQFKAWTAQGLDLQTVSVNVSLKQLENPHFVHKVSQILQETGLSPHNLILEISEGNLLPKAEMVEKTLHMVRRLGVLIAIDDFGTGYLSLQHLRCFPADFLKIDGSLVHDIATDSESEAIILTIIGLANSLKLQTIGEAVETQNQKETLQAEGCVLMQGHLFCPPMLPSEFNEIIFKDINERV